MSSDAITLTGLRAVGYHGVYDHERRDGQEFVVDLVLRRDLRAAALSDDVGDTVHYGEVAQLVAAEIEGPAVNLLETLGQRIADAVLGRYPLASVTVTVHKPQAPIPVTFEDVSITITRTGGTR